MSILAMDMSGYEAEETDRTVSQYDDEVLCAGWIPDLALQQALCTEQRTAIPEDLVTASADAFLEKMYSFQR
jgi:hypothetical protein